MAVLSERTDLYRWARAESGACQSQPSFSKRFVAEQKLVHYQSPRNLIANRLQEDLARDALRAACGMSTRSQVPSHLSCTCEGVEPRTQRGLATCRK